MAASTPTAGGGRARRNPRLRVIRGAGGRSGSLSAVWTSKQSPIFGSGKHPQTPVTAGGPPTEGGRGHRPSIPADGHETGTRRTTGPAPAPEPQPPTGPQTADRPRTATLPPAAGIFAPAGRETARQPKNRRTAPPPPTHPPTRPRQLRSARAARAWRRMAV